MTLTAGMVDIVAYLSLDHIFVARLTGITGHLGNKLATAQWAASTTSAVALPNLVGGSVLGRTVIELGSTNQRRTISYHRFRSRRKKISCS